MVEYDLVQIIQMTSQIAAALGVCIAAFYYVQILRNAEKEKRKQNILMRMPAMNPEWYDRYYYCHYIYREDLTPQERSGVTNSPEYNSNVMSIMHYYNLVGVSTMKD